MGEAAEKLADRVQGRVLRPDDDGFDEAAQPWNLAVRHRPDVLLEAAGAGDVEAGVRWAAERGLPIAVEASGHGATEAVARGLLISTRRMNGVRVDPDTRTAHVEAGAKWADVIAAAAPHGLIGASGSSSGVGVVGYALGGGLPILGRAFGFAADHVRRFEFVPADGRRRTVDAEHDPEVFEVLRGGRATSAWSRRSSWSCSRCRRSTAARSCSPARTPRPC